MFDDFYRNKVVLVTGHTGFKGSWLTIWLHSMGARVVGYALDPYTDKDNFVLSGIGSEIIDLRGDIRNSGRLGEVFETYKPEIVFHLAAQALVRTSYEFPVETYEVNTMGTINVLEAIRTSESVRTSIFITTDKCYENQEQVWGYRENDPMGGFDPYSSSKAACEIAIASWRRSFFNPAHIEDHKKSIISVRAGNVIGGGDWAADRIVPDCIRAIETGLPIEIRNPAAIRPWQHVLEALSGYLLLAKKAWFEPEKYGEAWNFGPKMESFATVWEIAQSIIGHYGTGELRDISDVDQPHESNMLRLDISKANFKLGWEPKLGVDQAIELTVDWYKRYRKNSVHQLCLEQINRLYGG